MEAAAKKVHLHRYGRWIHSDTDSELTPQRASSSAHGQQFENNVAAKAATKGKLTVMKEQAGKGDAQAKR